MFEYLLFLVQPKEKLQEGKYKDPARKSKKSVKSTAAVLNHVPSEEDYTFKSKYKQSTGKFEDYAPVERVSLLTNVLGVVDTEVPGTSSAGNNE